MSKNFINQALGLIPSIGFAVLALILTGSEAYANNLNTVSLNIINSMASLPGLVSAVAYISGLSFGVLGVFKLRQHVDRPAEIPLKDALIRFGAGGILLSVPYLYTVLINNISTQAGRTTSLVELLGYLIPLDPLSDDADLAADGTGVGAIFNNFLASVFSLPFLVSSFSYIAGLTIGVLGVLKLKAHVENPNQTPLKDAIARILAAGFLLALPFLLSVVSNTIKGNTLLAAGVGPDNVALEDLAAPGDAPANSIDEVSDNLIISFANMPGFVTIFAYLTGLVLAVKGVLDMMTHVTQGPNAVPLRSAVITLLVSGGLLSLPYVYSVLIGTVDGNSGWNLAGLGMYQGPGGSIMMNVGGEVLGFTNPADACGAAAGDLGLTSIFCNLWTSSQSLPSLLAAFSYVAGLVIGYLALIKLKDAVQNPNQTHISEAISRFATSAGLLLLPYIANVFYQSLAAGVMGFRVSTLEVAAENEDLGRTLDIVASDFVFSISGAMGFIFTGFGYLAGITLIIIGILRMMKTMQDGPRGPGGVGTIFTLLTGAALLSLGRMMGAVSTSLFGDGGAETIVTFAIAGGADADIVAYQTQLANFFQAVLAYMLIVGWVSFIRGLFLLRAVAEGQQQTSMMSAMTHIIAGAMLVNLGPFLEVLQDTLGVGAIATINFG